MVRTVAIELAKNKEKLQKHVDFAESNSFVDKCSN